MNLNNAVAHAGIPPNILLGILVKSLGEGWASDEVETTVYRLQDEFKVTIPEQTIEKINALKTLLNTDLFYTNASVFENIVTALNGYEVHPEALEIRHPEDIIYVIRTLSIDPKLFGREVVGYIKACMRDAGLIRYPDAIATLQPDIAGWEKIKPRPKAPEALDNINQVQGYKLFQTEQAVVNKLLSFFGENK